MHVFTSLLMPLRFAISTLQFVIFVHMLAIALCVLIMCLHPTIDRKLSTLYDKYENASLDEFDNCDYVHSVTDVKCTDLVIMQLNIRGIGSKKSRLIDLIDNSVQNKQPDILLISETWLTPFSPN